MKETPTPQHRLYMRMVSQPFCECKPYGDPPVMPGVGIAMPVAGTMLLKCTGCGKSFEIQGTSVRFTMEYAESVEDEAPGKPSKPSRDQDTCVQAPVPQTFSQEVTPYDRELMKKYGIKLE